MMINEDYDGSTGDKENDGVMVEMIIIMIMMITRMIVTAMKMMIILVMG